MANLCSSFQYQIHSLSNGTIDLCFYCNGSILLQALVSSDVNGDMEARFLHGSCFICGEVEYSLTFNLKYAGMLQGF